MKHCVLNKPDDSCMFYHCEQVPLNLSKPHQIILLTQHKTTKTISSVMHHNQPSTVMNHQDRITPIVTIIITLFIGAMQWYVISKTCRRKLDFRDIMIIIWKKKKRRNNNNVKFWPEKFLNFTGRANFIMASNFKLLKK